MCWRAKNFCFCRLKATWVLTFYWSNFVLDHGVCMKRRQEGRRRFFKNGAGCVCACGQRWLREVVIFNALVRPAKRLRRPFISFPPVPEERSVFSLLIQRVDWFAIESLDARRAARPPRPASYFMPNFILAQLAAEGSFAGALSLGIRGGSTLANCHRGRSPFIFRALRGVNFSPPCCAFHTLMVRWALDKIALQLWSCWLIRISFYEEKSALSLF